MSNITLHLGPAGPLNPSAVLELLDGAVKDIEQERALRKSYERARGAEAPELPEGFVDQDPDGLG